MFFQIHITGLKLNKVTVPSTVNISFAKVAIATEFLLATSEVYLPMASVATFSTNRDTELLKK